MGRIQKIPSTDDLMREVISELGYDRMSHEDVRESFDCIMRNIEVHMFALYEQYEQKVNSVDIPKRLLDNNPDELHLAENASRTRGFKEGIFVLFSHLYPELRKEFSSVSQSRMSRGGKSFESQFAYLLQLACFPFEQQHREHRTDFILPSHAAFDENSTVCAVASLKRTLRERWRQVVAELVSLRAPNVFLVTVDRKVTKGHINGICEEHRLHLVVLDEVKSKYPHNPRVLGFTQFANERLPNLQSQWSAGGLL